MIVNVGWNSFKSIKDQSGNTIFYSVENEYYSNDPNVNNIQRYFNYKTSKKNNGDFISIETPRNSDQADYEDNYKSNAIEKS